MTTKSYLSYEDIEELIERLNAIPTAHWKKLDDDSKEGLVSFMDVKVMLMEWTKNIQRRTDE